MVGDFVSGLVFVISPSGQRISSSFIGVSVVLKYTIGWDWER
jgi:hypothetical protein